MDAKGLIAIADKTFNILHFSEATIQRNYCAHFRISADVTAMLPHLILTKVKSAIEPKHIWSSSFLKNYWTENTNVSLWRCDEKTYREWVWYIIYIVSDIHCKFFQSIVFLPFSVQVKRVHQLLYRFVGMSK